MTRPPRVACGVGFATMAAFEIKYEHAKVHGKVTYQGKPLTFGTVLFMPVEAPKEGSIQPASGPISPEGTYELTSRSELRRRRW